MLLNRYKNLKKSSSIYLNLLNQLTVPVIICRRESNARYVIIFTNEKIDTLSPGFSHNYSSHNLFEVFPLLNQSGIPGLIQYCLSRNTRRLIDVKNLELGPFDVYNPLEIIPLSGKTFALTGTENPLKGYSAKDVDQLLSSVMKSSDALITLSAKGKITGWNKAAEDLYGYSEKEVTGKSFSLLFAEESSEDSKSVFATVLTGDIVSKHETIHKKSDASLIYVTEDLYPMRDAGGETTGITVLIRDLTSHVEARKALVESEERYKKLFESNPSVILIINPSNGQIADANPAACTYYGYTHNEITALNISSVNTQTKDVLLEKLYHSKNKQGAVYQFKHKKKNGDIRDVEVLTGPISIRHHTYVFSIVKDITEEKSAKEALLRAKKEIEESDNLKSAFLSNMSHEIRTPMNAILGFSELMEQHDFEREKQKSFLGLIKTNANHLINLIDSIIDMSKIETGLIKITPLNLKINDFMRELHSLFLPQTKLRKDIAFELIIPEHADHISVFTDPIRLKQIFRNLLDNALKFTVKGSIRLGYTWIEDNLIFFVKDTGIGIPHGQKELIFERFRQLDQSLTRKYEGTGLGLAIVKNLIELMDGKIWVKSSPGVGSEFYFSLPLLNQEALPDTLKNEQDIDLSGKTLLIVEDNDGSYEYLKELLLKSNATVIRANDGNTAIELCRHHPTIDLVLMDFMLPGQNGDKVALEIRMIRKDLPVIAQTALRIKEVAAETDPGTFSDIIEKPIAPGELISKIRDFIR